MSTYTNALVKPGYQVRHTLDGEELVSTAADGVVRMLTSQFNEARGMGSVRKAPSDAPAAAVSTPALAGDTETADDDGVQHRHGKMAGRRGL